MLAVAMRKMGYRVGIIDADITGPSIPNMFNIHTHAGGNEDGILPEVSKSGIEIMSMNLLLENENDAVIFRGPVLAGIVKQFYSDVIWFMPCRMLDSWTCLASNPICSFVW